MSTVTRKDLISAHKNNYFCFGVFRMGSWQFLADMPYRCVSMMMRWKLLWLLHHRTDDMGDLNFNVTPETCREAIKGTTFYHTMSNIY